LTTYQAIIFDLDDTLYPELSFVESGFRAVARHMEQHWSVPARACFSQLRELHHSGVRGNTFDKWLIMQGLPAEHMPQLVEVYRSHAPRIDLFQGMQALLLDLNEDHKIGLISDGLLDVQRRKFDALNVEPVFSSVVFSDRWGRDYWKPNARPYLYALQSLGVAANNAVYVGDNPAKDFVTARELGMQTVQFRHETGTYRNVSPPTVDHQPNVIVTKIEDLRGTLLSQS
jgi:putative hydrolase of the HAD superfamily